MDLSTQLGDLPDWFLNTPWGREWQAQETKDEHEKRKSWEAGLDALAERKKRELPPLAKAKAAAEVKVVKYDAASLAAKQERNAASLALSSWELTIGNEVAHYEKLLRESNTPVLRP